ncbi:MAG TPA: SEC-C metal-binding domain-containing protein [Syntrophobacteraceae bacterium]|nr:SEC-C metal-binding domain-containing protein [Syntrophobacteraceae bacterium]
MAKIGRNAPCPCGSGKKYKKCCLAKDEEARRARLEEQERKELLARKQAEEERALFEDEPDEEGPEEDFYDDDIDEMDEEEEIDETLEDSEAECRPRRRVPKESPPISDAEQEIVDRWWKEYKEMHEVEEIRQHLENFLRDHPKLVPNLELHWEVLFELGADYVSQGRHAEYIDLLLEMRNRFADSYLKSFGYYDHDIISHKITVGLKDEAANFLNYFREYPEHDPDNLFKVIEFMMANNCREMVTDLVQDVYYDVCTCSEIYGGDELIDILVMAYMAPFLKPDFTHADLEELASRLRTIRVSLIDELYQPDFLRQRFELILNNRKGWNIGDCKTRSEVIDRYYQVSLNFMGFLHEQKGKDWLAADFYRKMALRYLAYVIPEGKRPRETFVFTKKKIETTIARTCKSFLFLDSTAAIVSLNSLYWFAEYLEETGSIPEERKALIQQWCTELHNEVFPSLLKTKLSARAFERFPV